MQMRILDCFPYFDEKELLELRINLLHDYVDKFIIVDADHNHKGSPKPFTCKQTLKELGIDSSKIEVIELKLPSFSQEPNNWVRERMQRNFASNFIEDGDIAIISDCDEIINPLFVKYYANVAKNNPNNILRIPLANLCGRGDLRCYDEDDRPISWNSPFVCLKFHLEKYTLSDIRESHSLGSYDIEYNEIFTLDQGKIQDAGWHFGWMGGKEQIKKKGDIFIHGDEFEILPDYTPEEDKTDPLGRKDHILKKYSYLNFPSKLFELKNVKEFLLPQLKIIPIKKETDLGEDWFSFPNLYSKVVKTFNSGSKFVEVGSWKGRSSLFMATEIANSGKEIDFYCVDTWEGSIEHKYYTELQDLYSIFLNNMKPVEKYYHHLKTSSLKAVNYFDDQSLDFVFIDASHEYEDVKNDILAWLPKIKKGGILAGHDYYEDSTFGGVSKAVNELFNNFKVSENCFIIQL